MQVSIHYPERAEVAVGFAQDGTACVDVSDWAGTISIFGPEAMCRAIADAVNSHQPAPVSMLEDDAGLVSGVAAP